MSNKNPIEFKKQFDILSKGTDEYSTTVPFIVAYTERELEQCNHFVDIGAGRGNLAKPLSKFFQQTTIIEPNITYYHELMTWAQKYQRNMIGYNTTWQTVELDDVDCYLMSHVLYYVAKEDWIPFIDKAYRSLNSGGGIIIILNKATNGINALYDHFLPADLAQNIASAEQVIKTLQNRAYELKVKDFDSFIYASTEEEIYELIDFLLLGHTQFDSVDMQQKRSDYVMANLHKGNTFAINSDYSIITINKQ